MHLVACATPQEPLEAAPRTALLADMPATERWDGFWSSDVYVVRCTRENGSIEWFQLVDDDARPEATPRRKHGTRVLNFPVRARLQTRVVVAKSPAGRRMLVGTAGRVGARVPRTAE
jgi:hypothetical protein